MNGEGRGGKIKWSPDELTGKREVESWMSRWGGEKGEGSGVLMS